MVLRDQKDMPRALFEGLLREMRQEGVEEIGLFYLGESFLCRWLEEAIAFAKKTAAILYVFLTTNGSLAKPDRMEACFRAGLDSLKFSFNYADEAQFEEIARVKPKFYRDMVDNIRHARRARDKVFDESGHRCGLYASYIEYDGEQRERMISALAEIDGCVDQIYALPLYSQADLVTETETKSGWARCGIRCRAGPCSPRGTLPGTANCRRAASITTAASIWATSPARGSWKRGTPSGSRTCAPRI